jgi:hypothetical protein
MAGELLDVSQRSASFCDLFAALVMNVRRPEWDDVPLKPRLL